MWRVLLLLVLLHLHLPNVLLALTPLFSPATPSSSSSSTPTTTARANFYSTIFNSPHSEKKKNDGDSCRGCFHYFAFGSNMAPWVMTFLRGIPIHNNGMAAVLPDYRLAFHAGGSTTTTTTPAPASIQYSPGDCVHGVLYSDLQADEFTRLGWTEGVPLAYQWEQCHVIPYVGNGKNAGQQALSLYRDGQKKNVTNEATGGGVVTVSAFSLTTLTGSKAAFERNSKTKRGSYYGLSDNPTSTAYLQILQQGAAHWKLDRPYQISLSKVKTTTGSSVWTRTFLESVLSKVHPVRK